MAENFFSILKTEYIYRHKPQSFQESNDMINNYIHFYNHERILLPYIPEIHSKYHLEIGKFIFSFGK